MYICSNQIKAKGSKIILHDFYLFLCKKKTKIKKTRKHFLKKQRSLMLLSSHSDSKLPENLTKIFHCPTSAGASERSRVQRSAQAREASSADKANR